jgi:hypothetical protein
MAEKKQPWGDLTTLRYLGQGLADAKQDRVSMNNRFKRAGTAISPGVTKMVSEAADLHEGQYEKMLMEEYKRRVPEHVREWAKTIPGLASGELFPRIIAAIGHPRIASPELPDPEDSKTLIIGDPYERSPQELRQYMGAGDPKRKPFKGMTQEDLFAMGKIRQVRPLLFTWSSNLVKMSSPGGAHTKNPGQPKSVTAANSGWFKDFVNAKQKYSGHVGKCMDISDKDDVNYHLKGLPGPPGPFPECYELHHKHQWECHNTKRPPARSNGCAIGAHPEWGEVGSPWRPGHIDMAAHRKLHQIFADKLWEISEVDDLQGIEPYIPDPEWHPLRHAEKMEKLRAMGLA